MKTAMLAPALLVFSSASGNAEAEGRLRAHVGIQLEEAWDSSVQNSGEEDFVTRITPRAGLLHAGPRLAAGVEARLALHQYARGIGEDTVNERVSGFARLRLSRRISAAASAVVVRADDPVVLERQGVVLPLGGIFETTATLRGDARLTRRVDAFASYLYRLSRFELASDSSLIHDGDEHLVAIGAGWRATRRLELGGSLRGQYFGSSDGASSKQAISPALFLAYQATRQVMAKIEAGPAWFLPDAALTYYLSLGASMSAPRGRIAAAYVREILGGTGSGESTWSESARVQASAWLARTMVLRGLVSLTRSGIAPSEPAELSTLVGRASLGWISRSGRVGIDLMLEHRVHGGPAVTQGSDQRTIAGVRLVMVAGADIPSLSEVP